MRISICVGEYAKVPYSIAGLELSVYCIEELCFCMKENAFLLDASPEKLRISICVGEYAKVPYSIAGLELSVYCIEELCFCMKENAFLLDASLMNDGLVNWIDKDCALPALAGELYRMVHKKGSLSAFVTMILEYTGLYDTATVQEVEQILKKGVPALAGELYRMVHKKGSLSAFVTMILEYTGLYDTATVQEVEQILKKGVGLNSIEKRKSGIDVLTGKKKYRAAVKGYLELLEVWEELDREGKELPAQGKRNTELR